MVVFSSASISFWNSSSLEDSLSPVRHSRISFRFWSGVPCKSTSTSSSELQIFKCHTPNYYSRPKTLTESFGERTSELWGCTVQSLFTCVREVYLLKRFISLLVLKLWLECRGASADRLRPRQPRQARLPAGAGMCLHTGICRVRNVKYSGFMAETRGGRCEVMLPQPPGGAPRPGRAGALGP